MRRELRSKIFIGSTTEEIEKAFTDFLISEKMCPGNYVDIQLYKHGNVYQLVFMYAVLI